LQKQSPLVELLYEEGAPMRNQFHLPLLLLLLCVLSISNNVNAQANGGAAAPHPPMAEKKPKTTNIHGVTLVDDYFWIREKTNPSVLAHLKAEDAYAESLMKHTAPLQEKLYNEMLSHIKQTDTNVPYRYGNHFYYSRTEEGKQYPIFCRKKGSLEAPEEVILDMNELAKGHAFMGIGALSPSDDGNLLAYSTDSTGYRQFTLQVKDLRTGQVFPEKIERVTGVVWANDNKTLFYVTEDATTKRSDRLTWCTKRRMSCLISRPAARGIRR
jgi:oligopeptidase B